MIKTIILDMDGTILDSYQSNIMSKKSVCQRHGLTFDTVFFRKHLGETNTSFRKKLGKKQEKKIKAKKIAKEDTQLYMAYYPHYNKLFPDTHKFLSWCQNNNITLSLYTNEQKKIIKQTIQKFGLESTFNTIITRNDVKKPKPDPQGYKKLMKKMSIKAKDTIIIEDSLIGLQAAVKSGARVIQIDHYQRGKTFPGVEVTLHSRMEIIEYLKSH